MIDKIKSVTEQIFREIIDIRRHLHKYPELSFKEHNTSKYIQSILDSWGIPFDNIGDTGVVVLLAGKDPFSKTIALRADFDALPILEENDVEYCSRNKGVMHACGHDAHTASLLGVVKVLDTLKEEWVGQVKFIFQPAEEVYPGGAQQMISQGVLENPQVQKIFAQHVFPDLEVGKVGFAPGWYMASADELHVEVIGSGGHAALPEKYNNPIIASAELITRLENHFLPYRSYPAVFAIGFMQANGYTNVIPDRVVLKGTFRAMDEEFRQTAHNDMKDIARQVADKFSVDINFIVNIGYPALHNDEFLTSQAISYARDYLGKENVVNLSVRMTAEDFAYFGYQVPSCFYRIGVSNTEKGIVHGLHTSKFDIDESALKVGVGLMSYLAIKS